MMQYDFAHDDEAAKARAEAFRNRDPFPSIPTSLLSSVEIEDYVRVTGMIHPFDSRGLKSASYQAHVGGDFIWWNENEKQRNERVHRGSSMLLPANSITFVQVEPIIRLPHYIALRFNLRITHVHRGLLLGTGPLVDPGFEGKLLIPLHNLTSSAYDLDTDKALIWIEFTKTTFNFLPREEEAFRDRSGRFREFPDEKKYISADRYIYKASKSEPIRSSIPGAIQKASEQADIARQRADRAERTLFKIGIGGTFIAFIAVLGLYLEFRSAVQDAMEMAGIMRVELGKLSGEASDNSEEIQDVRRQIEQRQGQIRVLEQTMVKMRQRIEEIEKSSNK